MATLYQVKQVNGVYTSETVEVKPKSGKPFLYQNCKVL